MSEKIRIYFAGPLFTAAEKKFNADITQALNDIGYEVFLPQEQEQKVTTANNIFANNVLGLLRSDVVVAVMDGPDPDSGTCWECGYAFAQEVPVILLFTDSRREEQFGPFNLMLHQSANEVVEARYVEAYVPSYIAHLLRQAIERHVGKRERPSLRTFRLSPEKLNQPTAR